MTHTLNAYVYEDSLQAEAAGHERNYWDAYVPEMFDELGLKAVKLSRKDLLDSNRIRDLKFIVLGELALTEEEKAALHHWVTLGGRLIGFATAGADDLFNIRPVKTIRQSDSPYTISAYYRFSPDSGKEPDPLYDYQGVMLPIVSERVIQLENSGDSKGTLHEVGYRRDTGHDAIAERSLGAGKTCYFGFSLPQTLWTIHQGRPVDRDYDGDGLYRTNDAIILSRSTSLQIPYADCWMRYLEPFFAEVPQPFLHQLPPFADSSVPDFMLHYGGDDENDPQVSMSAAKFFHERGMPYHINLMPSREGTFAIDKEQYTELRRLGTDLSLHFDFVAEFSHYSKEDLEKQLNWYLDSFGERPIVTVNHCSMFTGWAEHARWAASCGMKGDNTRVHSFVPPDNGINMFGMGFGTVYPHFVYDDYEHGNARIPYVYIPIVFFEPRIYEETREQDVNRIHTALDRAACFRWTLNMFIHPLYIANEHFNKECPPAVDEMLRYISEKGYRVLHQNTNQLCQWWIDRSETDVQMLASDPADKSIRLSVETRRADGVLIKFPLADVTSGMVGYSMDGDIREGTVQEQNGGKWLLCHVPSGRHEVVLRASHNRGE